MWPFHLFHFSVGVWGWKIAHWGRLLLRMPILPLKVVFDGNKGAVGQRLICPGRGLLGLIYGKFWLWRLLVMVQGIITTIASIATITTVGAAVGGKCRFTIAHYPTTPTWECPLTVITAHNHTAA